MFAEHAPTCQHFPMRMRGSQPIRAWHDLTCPAVIPYVSELRCECGGAQRAHEAHRDAVMRDRDHGR